ncbi:acyl-CoA thioesterase [Yeosuana sp. MJ-SS3]|uniref:Acyl-CoA thioesterase n=1 Tax=Gilvirhabdus luticola TaxID=3079858 RepID=A0ABU3U953_9FLAO|nr:acyl-CoA thioesterase [Yeosuana sp. MJ-SS3]MDU8886887.1 acyl-CoA thioesterase [Yeosuana sp. MJ-SS3]
MQVYENFITVSDSDLDSLNHVNNVRYVQWVNDIAKEHWQKNATPNMLKDHFWVMINHCIEYKSSALLNDQVKLKTFVIKSEGVTSTRVVEMYNEKNEKLIARSETNWCFMNSQTKKPTRITQEVIDLFK